MNDKDLKCRKLPILKTSETKVKPAEKKDGVIFMGCPMYGDDVREWKQALYDLDLTDKNYLENYEKIKDKDVSELTRDEVLTAMTRIVRAERFCDGAIAKALESGYLEALCLRLKDVVG